MFVNPGTSRDAKLGRAERPIPGPQARSLVTSSGVSRLGVSSRAEAIRAGMSRGLLDARGPAAIAPTVRRSEIRSAVNDGVHIAYQVVADGPVDLLFVHGFVSHLDLAWEGPQYAAFFAQLGRGARHPVSTSVVSRLAQARGILQM